MRLGRMATISEPSGHESLDHAAVELLHRAAPFRFPHPLAGRNQLSAPTVGDRATLLMRADRGMQVSVRHCSRPSPESAGLMR